MENTKDLKKTRKYSHGKGLQKNAATKLKGARERSGEVRSWWMLLRRGRGGKKGRKGEEGEGREGDVREKSDDNEN